LPHAILSLKVVSEEYSSNPEKKNFSLFELPCFCELVKEDSSSVHYKPEFHGAGGPPFGLTNTNFTISLKFFNFLINNFSA
jgi:hypothetical protein